MIRTPKDNQASARTISRRAMILGASQAALVAALVARMRYMQVNQADQYRLLAEENRINIRLIAPARGIIFDRNGETIAQNEQNYRIVIVREDAGDIDATIARLARLVELDPEDLERAAKESKRLSPFVPVTLADRLAWEDLATVAVNAPALPGVTPEVGLSRQYPLGQDFAHIVGYVGPVSKYDLGKIEDPDPLLQIPNFQIGKLGVEDKFELSLRGRAGSRQIEVNAVGRVMRELDRKEGVAGNDLQLTADAGLQNFMQARLGSESASAVVIDTNNGDILAIASSPSFDPNKFVRGISVADYAEYTENKYLPLSNKSVQGTYPPGSTYKMVVALAALKAGVITPDEEILCIGYKTLGNRRFYDWKRSGHGWIALNEAIFQSCDVYFYEIAERVGIEKISEMARMFGLGARHELPMSAVAAGLAPTKAWKKANRGTDWLVGDTLNTGIGQGFVLTSPLQLAVMTARLASGRNIRPRLIKTINGVETAIVGGEAMDIDPGDLALVRQGMIDVSNYRRGTGYRARIAEARFALAGKSGTSQVRNISVEERASGVISNADLPWERRDHALFVAYAPYEDPQVACAVVVEHGGSGSGVAAPIVRDIVLQALYGELPPLSAYPSAQRDDIRKMRENLVLRAPAKGTGGKVRI
ncbi:MAG: penicillin-binding protein 2 [Paracoccaceae bacterium]